ncbi:hypothetical protein GCM10027289_24110 [Tsukamurella serpentis]
MPSQNDHQTGSEGAWLEAIGLFGAVREGRQQSAWRLLQTSSEPDLVVGNLLSLLGVLLHGISPDDLDRFVDAAHQAGPPPPFGLRPDLPSTVAHHSSAPGDTRRNTA